MFKEIKNSLYDNGIMFSETSDLLVSEPVLTDIMAEAGADVFDLDTIDTTKVLALADELGINNLGGFGTIAGTDADNFVFHIPGEWLDHYERQIRLGKAKEIKIIQELIDKADSYL